MKRRECIAALAALPFLGASKEPLRITHINFTEVDVNHKPFWNYPGAALQGSFEDVCKFVELVYNYCDVTDKKHIIKLIKKALDKNRPFYLFLPVYQEEFAKAIKTYSGPIKRIHQHRPKELKVGWYKGEFSIIDETKKWMED